MPTTIPTCLTYLPLGFSANPFARPARWPSPPPSWTPRDFIFDVVPDRGSLILIKSQVSRRENFSFVRISPKKWNLDILDYIVFYAVYFFIFIFFFIKGNKSKSNKLSRVNSELYHIKIRFRIRVHFPRTIRKWRERRKRAEIRLERQCASKYVVLQWNWRITYSQTYAIHASECNSELREIFER